MIRIYYTAKVKWAVLRLIGYIMHPWISDLGVRVIQHKEFQSYSKFKEVYNSALAARKAGQSYIVVKTEPPPQKPPLGPNIHRMSDHKPRNK